ncbi:MAG: ATP-binding protein [Planctomycetota bacterium]
MVRRLSTKWMLTALSAVVLPFLGFAWYVDKEVAKWNATYVQYDLLSIAGEMADRLDSEIREHRLDIELWGTIPFTEWTTAKYGGDETAFVPMLERMFDQFIRTRRYYDLLLAIDENGQLVASNTKGTEGQPLSQDVLDNIAAHDYPGDDWFQKALRGEAALKDHHRSDLLPPRNTAPGSHPENYHIGFAVPVRSQVDPEKVVGVVYGLMNWSHIQHDLLRPIRPSIPGLASPDLYRSSYAWLWMSDANTIIGHQDAELYTRKVGEPPIDLPQLVEAAREKDWGMYPAYSFRGLEKTAAFKHCAGPDRGGFGWVLGVGVDDRDIYEMVNELHGLLVAATLLALGIVVVGTVVVARRTTRPILLLKEQTEKISKGDLEARVEVRSRDELGDLARSFNHMTVELAESRRRLVKAEKDSAWREMARQVAHEIKNPLTPISLSVDLLKRARDEGSPQFDAIFDRTVDLVQRQVEGMRRIASDFSAFAGAHRPRPEIVDAASVLEEVLELNSAWASESGIDIERSIESVRVFVDRGELRRVLINLVSNALEAMNRGGRLKASVARVADPAGGRVEIVIRDTGVGISTEVRQRLFEPYFTTRTGGTGLGLAIARRLVELMAGTIEILPNPEGQGTLARVVLREHRD